MTFSYVDFDLLSHLELIKHSSKTSLRVFRASVSPNNSKFTAGCKAFDERWMAWC